MLKETGILNYPIEKVKTNKGTIAFDTEYHCVCVGFWCSRLFCISRHDFILDIWVCERHPGILQQKSTTSQVKRVQPNQVLEGAAVLRADWL